MARIGIVTGLKSEERLAHDAARKAGASATIAVRCDGPGVVQARIAAKQLAAEGATLLVSFGFAGALAADLTPGTLVVPKEILNDAGQATPVDLWAHGRVVAALRGETVRVESLLGTGKLVATPEEKRALARKFSAIAVDMESGGVATVAKELGIPFIAVRAIADSAERSIPDAARAGMTEDGRINALAVIAELALQPTTAPEVFHLARDTATANAALGRAAGPVFLSLVEGR